MQQFFKGIFMHGAHRATKCPGTPCTTIGRAAKTRFNQVRL
jgi:hypothetical protein